jgi:hypothetical protein
MNQILKVESRKKYKIKKENKKVTRANLYRRWMQWDELRQIFMYVRRKMLMRRYDF